MAKKVVKSVKHVEKVDKSNSKSPEKSGCVLYPDSNKPSDTYNESIDRYLHHIKSIRAENKNIDVIDLWRKNADNLSEIA